MTRKNGKSLNFPLDFAVNLKLLFAVVFQSLSCARLFCKPTDCSLPGSSLHAISQARIQRGLYFLLQGIFSTQGSNPCLLHWQGDSLPLSHQGSPYFKTSPILLFGETLLWEGSLVFSLLGANNKSFLMIFGFVVSIGSTPTKM